MTMGDGIDALPAEAREVLQFWFLELLPENWFRQTDTLDALIEDRFGTTLAQASQGALDHWAETARGRLALIIVLDQFSRNIYRGTPRAFAQDECAQRHTMAAIANGEDEKLSIDQRQFLYMPLMHAEDRELQAKSIERFEALAASAETILGFAREHRDIVEGYGRFPYRNAVLDRESTLEEAAFIRSEGNPFS